MSTVRVEQMLIGWSRTSNGKNVLAKSPGWPEGSRSEWVSTLGDFLDPTIDRLVHETGEAPWLVEYLPSPHGAILMAKAYAIQSQRAGEFQVHALLDPSNTLGPQHLAGLVEDGTLLRERPAEVEALESVSVTVPGVPRSEVAAIARALHALHHGGAITLRAATVGEAAELVSAVAAGLPAVVAGLPARSVVTDAATVDGLDVVVAPWTRGSGGSEAPVPKAYRGLAERVMSGEVNVPPVGVPDWLDLALLDPATLTRAELARGLASDQARHWFDLALTTAHPRGLLLEIIRAGELPAAAWPATVEGEAVTVLGRGVRLQDALAKAPDTLVQSWAHHARVPIESTVLVDRLHCLRLDPASFRLRTGTTQWSPWTVEAWRQWLNAGSELAPRLRASIDSPQFPAGFAHVLDNLPHDVIDQVASQLARWPEDYLPDLAKALIHSKDAPPDLLIQTLDRLPGREVRALVHRNWPDIGHQLGLPATVVQALKPRRFGWG